MSNIDERADDPFESGAFENLKQYQGQLDEDGVCVAVSRQALEEVIKWCEQARARMDAVGELNLEGMAPVPPQSLHELRKEIESSPTLAEKDAEHHAALLMEKSETNKWRDRAAENFTGISDLQQSLDAALAALAEKDAEIERLKTAIAGERMVNTLDKVEIARLQLVVEVADEYQHWRKVNPHIKGGENYVKRIREALAAAQQEG